MEAMASERPVIRASILVGAAKADISPRSPVRLMGYAARAQSPAPTNVAQRLFARALAIGEGSEASVVVTLDNCILPRGVSEAIRARLVETEGLGRQRIALTVTHTHSAPCLSGAAPNIFAQAISAEDRAQIDTYTRFFIDATVSAVREALQHRRPARMAWGQGRVDFAQNRRTPGGPVDPSLPVLRVTAEDGTLVAVLTSYACHCTTLSGEFNASHGDWAGVAAAALEERHPGAVGLVAIGCGADANPAPRGTLALAEQHGRSLATEVERLIGLPLEPLSAAPLCRLESVEIPFRPHFTRPQWEQRATNSGIVGFHARRWLERLDRGEAPRPSLPYPIQTFTFSTNLAMVFLGGEVVVDYALRLKSELDPRRLWIHGYANEVPGYIPSRRILQEGGYEAESSLWYYDQPQQFDPALEDRIIDAVHRQLPPAFQPPQPRGEMTEPLPMDRALESFRLPPGWTMDLVAGDDLVQSPVAIDFGADGRLWVCEMADYPNGLRGGLEPGGRVKVLTDTDGDGRMDRAEVVADGMPFPTGLMAWNDGVLVCAAPEVRWIRPGQGPGEVLLSGFATHNYQARVNGLRWGLDGWVYGAGGLFGGQIHSHRAGTDTDARQRDFRFHPESGEFQALPGVSQQGRVRDDFGEWFGNDNGSLLWHFPLPAEAAAHGVEPVQARIPSNRDDNRVFPISRTLERFNDPHTANHLTSACAPEIYRDTALGADLASDALVCEPVHNLIRRARLSRDGVTFAARRVAEESSREFLSSSDSWFRPVEIRTGTDGALWVVDLHRFVIEHPRWIPPERLERLDVRAGAEGGRIYRLRRRDSAVTALPRVKGLAPESLAQRLGSPNGPLRDLAQRALLSLPEPSWRRALPAVTSLASAPRSPSVRAQALSLLALRGGLTEPLLASALHSEHPGLVSVALGWMPSGTVGKRLLALHGEALDHDPALRFHRALALSRGDAGAVPILIRQLSRWPEDPWVRAGAITAARKRPGVFLEALSRAPELLRHRGAPMAELLAAWDHPVSIDTAERCLVLLDRTASPEDPLRLSWWMAAEALKTPSPTLDALRRRWRETLSARLPELLGNPSLPEPIRAAAARLRVAHLRSAGLPPSEAVALLGTPLSANTRRALCDALQAWGHPATVTSILEGWRSRAESDRRDRLELLLGRPDWIPGLLAAIERGTVAASELSPTQTAGLRQHRDGGLREQASRLLPHSAPDMGTLLKRFSTAADMQGDAQRGRGLFEERCASCHAIRGPGPAVGPDLASFATKPFEAFVRAIVDPDAAVDPRHSAVTVSLADGREWTGVVGESSATRLTLLLPGGSSEGIPKASIRSQTPLGRSLMPEGLTEGWTPRSVADLWAWIRHD